MIFPVGSKWAFTRLREDGTPCGTGTLEAGEMVGTEGAEQSIEVTASDVVPGVCTVIFTPIPGEHEGEQPEPVSSTDRLVDALFGVLAGPTLNAPAVVVPWFVAALRAAPATARHELVAALAAIDGSAGELADPAAGAPLTGEAPAGSRGVLALFRQALAVVESQSSDTRQIDPGAYEPLNELIFKGYRVRVHAYRERAQIREFWFTDRPMTNAEALFSKAKAVQFKRLGDAPGDIDDPKGPEWAKACVQIVWTP